MIKNLAHLHTAIKVLWFISVLLFLGGLVDFVQGQTRLGIGSILAALTFWFLGYTWELLYETHQNRRK